MQSRIRIRPGKQSRIIRILAVVVVLCLLFFLLPVVTFDDPASTVLTDSNNILLSARTADDGQWRFPASDSVPIRFATAVRVFEDEYFYYHPGVNPISLVRAAIQDLRAGEIVSGGSTITMQVVRMARGNRRRNIPNKCIDILLALRLEATHSKQDILRRYVSHAPYGGNVVGVDAAAWRYYGRSVDRLSWGESASLAVLPNAPSRVYPGKNDTLLLSKRNRLLHKLYQKGFMDSLTCSLACDEPLPGSPLPLPDLTPHLLDRAIEEGRDGKITRTTIDPDLQTRITELVRQHYLLLHQNGINNAAVLVLSVPQRKVIAYVGNTPVPGEEGRYVDMIRAQRSSGSILKPILYAAMLDDGLILPHSLVPDIPTHYRSYAPENFDHTYRGVVPASEALIRSLNVPAVRMLKEYGLERFYNLLGSMGFTSVNRGADNYGLTLILGGAEVTLWDLGKVYLGWAETLNKIETNQYRYENNVFRDPLYYFPSENDGAPLQYGTPLLTAGSIWQTFEVLSELTRPVGEEMWQTFTSSKKIAWKTGTSFGFRDAWSVGITPEYVVAVWAGNADGEGRPGLTGLNVAAPLLFDVYNLLPQTSWFEPPYDELTEIAVCSKSGYRITAACEEADTLLVPTGGLHTGQCRWHKIIHLDKSGKKRVNSDCYPIAEMIKTKWFVLSPVQEWYYRRNNPEYRPLPDYLSGCDHPEETVMQMVYPRETRQVFVPKTLDGKRGRVVFEVAHQGKEATIFWHLDDQYLGETTHFHQMELNPKPGIHTLTLVDDQGNILTRTFEVVPR